MEKVYIFPTFDWRYFIQSLTEECILFFQLAIQENYRNNPFHNFRHCFCVSQMMYGMIHLCNLQVWRMLKVSHCACAPPGYFSWITFISFPGEADSHRYGDSDDSCSVSRPGPPWLQQHVRLPILPVRGVNRRRSADVCWPQRVLTFLLTTLRNCQWTVKVVRRGEDSGMKTERFRLSQCQGCEGENRSYHRGVVGIWS